jgi:uncharacterized protein (TIGR00369 family)
MSPLKDEGRCFACGRANPDGLQLPIRTTGHGVELDWAVPAKFQGWEEIVHGGIVATILDELCAWAGTDAGENVVTAELVVRWRRPLRVGLPFRGTGRVIERKGRLLIAESRITDADGSVIAEATGKMMKA